MKQSEVEVGGVYRVRWHDGSFTDVRITGETIRQRYSRYGDSPRRVGYRAVNLATGRHVVIKSAAKLRERVG